MANKKFYYKKRKPAPKNVEAENAQIAKYSEKQLMTPVEALGLSESTVALLQKNKVKIAADLVKRNEKDMYKIQGLNKKILLEVKNALKQKGMSIRADEEPQEKQQKPAQPQNSAQSQKPAKQKSGRDDKKPTEDKNAPKRTRFGLADRDVEEKSADDKQKKQEKQKPEKLTEPLAQGEWRKVLKGGKWGYSNGFSIVIPTMYDEIFAFKEGLASVEIGEKCGYIDGENNLVIPLMYDTAMSFSEGLAMVCVGEKCGYINKNNEMVIEPQFDAATAFEGGEAKVKKDGKWATLTPDGNLTWI